MATSNPPEADRLLVLAYPSTVLRAALPKILSPSQKLRWA